jgi:hypothetical protein
MSILEKLVTLLSALTVLLVGTGVTFSTIIPKESGTPKIAEQTELKVTQWLTEAADKAAGRSSSGIIQPVEFTAQGTPRVGKTGRPAPRIDKKEIAKRTKEASFDNYVEADGRPIPPEQAVQGVPWLRAQPGVTYYRPKKVPRILYEKVQHFRDAIDTAREGGGEFLETPYGNAYKVTWVKPGSHLNGVVGLTPGDQILSVNGHKIGNSFTAARQLYEQLKNEKRFAVKVLRDGQPTMLSFTVK